MILAINGKTSDTVGKLIQYLISKQNFPDLKFGESHFYYPGVTGDVETTVQTESGWKLKKFAGKLTQVASILTGVPISKWEDPDFKKTYMPKEWNYFKQMFECNEDNKDGYAKVPMTYNRFLQKLWEEGIREGVHKDAWINALFSEYVPTSVKVFKDDHEEYEKRLPKWIITDLRFKNEYKAIKEREGLCVKVESRKIPHKIYSNSYETEEDLRDVSFNWTLYNNGTIEDLEDSIRFMLIYFNLLNP